VGDVHDVITCAKIQIEIFMGYDFTVGLIFDFPIDFSMGLTTVQRYCAACDYSYSYSYSLHCCDVMALCTASQINNKIIRNGLQHTLLNNELDKYSLTVLRSNRTVEITARI